MRAFENDGKFGAKPTMRLRHVWREVEVGNKKIFVLALQQLWEDGERFEWRDVEIEFDERD